MLGREEKLANHPFLTAKEEEMTEMCKDWVVEVGESMSD